MHETWVLKMSLRQSFLFHSGICLVALLCITACGPETDDCRPDGVAASGPDRSLLVFLQGESFALHSYIVPGENSAAAVKGIADRGAYLSFLENGEFLADTGVNRISGDEVLGINQFTGRYFVKDGQLHFCGNIVSTQLAGISPELKAQDDVMRKVLFASPEISTQGQSIELRAGGSSITAISSKTP